MRIHVWGCRGSLAAPGPETVRYGGNTSCVEVRPSDGRLVILDAGTGIRNLGVSFGSDLPERVDILLTHLHLDHIEGLGFFTPIWEKECEVHIWGPPSPGYSLRQRIATYFSPPLFPIHIDDIPSKLVVHDAPPEGWELGGLTVKAAPVNHPGPTFGYRLEEDGKAFTYISDHEPALAIDMTAVEPEWVSGYGLAFGADALFHDAQYTEDEYLGRVGWGHSSIEHTVTFAQISKVRRLFMFHHDPLHSDAKLETMLVRARELWGEDGETVVLSHEGMEIEVS